MIPFQRILLKHQQKPEFFQGHSPHLTSPFTECFPSTLKRLFQTTHPKKSPIPKKMGQKSPVMRRNNPWPLERDKGLSSPPPGCTPTFSTKYQNQGQDLRCYIQWDILKNICVSNKTYFQQYAWCFREYRYTWSHRYFVYPYYMPKKQIYTVATLPPLNGRLRNTRLPRPCWTAAAPSSPQSQCAAAYNVDRVFPAPQGIHPQNTGPFRLWRLFWVDVFFLVPKVSKKNRRML